jgi:UDP-glucose/GDP-mannose dehydrogenase family, UDP binding domain
LILTEWDQFRALDLDRVKAALRSPVVVDLRNIYKPADLAAKGFTYVNIGRPVAAHQQTVRKGDLCKARIQERSSTSYEAPG